MALGYENTGIGPKLIANAGNAMTESIRQFGEKLQKDIVAHNTDKQVVGFLSEAKNIDINSPTFQADLVGTLARYPMAAGDQRALMGARLLATGWEQKQTEKMARVRYGENDPYEPPVTPAAALGGGGNGLMGGGPMPAPSGERSALGSPEPGFNFGGISGNTSRLGVPFNPSGDAGLPVSGGVVSEEPIVAKDPTALPATLSPEREAMLDRYKQSQKGRPAKEARRNIAQMEYKMLSEQDQENTAKRKPANNRPIFRTIPGVGVGVWNPESRSFDVAAEGKPTQRWINLGSHWENTETGEQKPVELSPAQKSVQEGRQAVDADRDAARVDRTAARDAAQQASVIKTQIEDRKRDLGSTEKEITRLKKISQPSEQDQKDLGELQKAHGGLMKKIGDLEAKLGEVGVEKKLDSDAAMELLKEAGGDREKARELARQRGYSL